MEDKLALIREASGARHISTKAPVEAPSLLTGMEVFDDTGFFSETGGLYFVGARPGHGKTSLLLKLAANLAKRTHVLFLSHEMLYKQVRKKLLAHIAKTDDWDATVANNGTSGRVEKAEEELAKLSLDIVDGQNKTLNFKAACNIIRMYRNAGYAGAVFVDYLQIVEAGADNRRENCEIVSSGFRELAKDLGVPIICAAQLKRDEDSRIQEAMGKKTEPLPEQIVPVQNAIQWSAQPEQDADGLVFMVNMSNYKSNTDEVLLGIRKHRYGQNNIIYRYSFQGAQSNFIRGSKA